MYYFSSLSLIPAPKDWVCEVSLSEGKRKLKVHWVNGVGEEWGESPEMGREEEKNG